MTSSIDVTGVTTALYNLLKPLEPEDRHKVVRAAQMLLGDVDLPLSAVKTAVSEDGSSEQGYSPRVRIWLQKNGLDHEKLSQVFHLEGGVADIIADVPGKTGKDKALNAYILTGMQQFLLIGEPKFDDKSARENCKSLGCFNDTNHATYIKDKGNIMSGSKDGGWVLTGPGLSAAADLIKGIAN